MMIDVRLCRHDEVLPAADVLAGSFQTDPIYESIFPDPKRRSQALASFMRAPVSDAQREETCWVAVEGRQVRGVAVWQSPGNYPWSWWRQVRSLPSIVETAIAAPSSLVDLVRFGSNVDERFPDEAVWYLQALGVASESRGEGVGSSLLGPALDRADREDTPCYLETVNPEAKRLYEKAGFTTVSVEWFLPEGPPHWTMRRPG